MSMITINDSKYTCGDCGKVYEVKTLLDEKIENCYICGKKINLLKIKKSLKKIDLQNLNK